MQSYQHQPGDFDALKAAVQNGANAVYFGGEVFNARVNGKNFSNEELVEAIQYAKLRGVKTHLTLNILIKITATTTHNIIFIKNLFLIKYF